MQALDLTPLWITLKLAGITTIFLLILGIPLGWWLARSRLKWKFIIEVIIALPLVLPPTVLGFYLLLALGPHGFIGRLFESLGGTHLAFSFSGLVIGSMIYSLPFVVQPIKNAFESIDSTILEAAATLGANSKDRFFSVALPLSKGGIFSAAILGFAHTLGEFGVVLMIGGNIPGKTQVISIAIYDQVESLNYSQAHWLSGGLLIFSFVLLFLVYIVNRNFLGGRS